MLQWRDEYSVKLPFFDRQHQQLLEIGQGIQQLLDDYQGQDTFDEIAGKLSELADYTRYHFAQEEKVMAEFAYPELEEHVKEHRAFIAYLESLDMSAIDQNQEETLRELMKFITSWVLRHIMKTDFKYSDFLLKAMT